MLDHTRSRTFGDGGFDTIFWHAGLARFNDNRAQFGIKVDIRPTLGSNNDLAGDFSEYFAAFNILCAFTAGNVCGV